MRALILSGAGRYADPWHPYAETSARLASLVAEAGFRHPLVWAREFGRSRLVYDALGHDPRSYDSEGHRALIAQALGWLSHVPAPTAGRAGAVAV